MAGETGTRRHGGVVGSLPAGVPERVGSWTVDRDAGPQRRRESQIFRTMWRCVCDCGAERWIRGSTLRANKSLSCGCVPRRRQGQSRHVRGKRGSCWAPVPAHVGRWTVDLAAGPRWIPGKKTSLVSWRCTCACGAVRWIRSGKLREGKTGTPPASQSCGCLQRDVTAARNRSRKLIPGEAGPPAG